MVTKTLGLFCVGRCHVSAIKMHMLLTASWLAYSGTVLIEV